MKRHIQRKFGWKRPATLSSPQMQAVQAGKADPKSFSSLHFREPMIQAGRRIRSENKLYYNRESNGYSGFPLATLASKNIRASEPEIPYIRTPIEVEGYEGTFVIEVAPTLDSFYWYLSTHPETVIYWR